MKITATLEAMADLARQQRNEGPYGWPGTLALRPHLEALVAPLEAENERLREALKAVLAVRDAISNHSNRHSQEVLRLFQWPTWEAQARAALALAEQP